MALADQFLTAIWQRDYVLFQQLGTLLQMGGEKWRDARFSDLGVSQKTRGRKSKPYDLKCVGPIAIINRLFARVKGVDDKPPLDYLVTKEELREEIHRLQIERGLKGKMIISDSDLSRLANGMGVAKFMDSRSAKVEGQLVEWWLEANAWHVTKSEN